MHKNRRRSLARFGRPGQRLPKILADSGT